MLMELSVTTLATAIIAYAQEIEQNRRMTEENKKQARLALAKAFNATEGYYASLAAGALKNVEKEHEIADLWDTVAILMEPFNRPLAYRLGLKSRFWREDAAWSAQAIADAKIQLDSVRRDGRISLQ